MNLENVTAAFDTIGWLIAQATTPGEETESRVQMAAALVLANCYVTEYLIHLREGADPYDALISTAKGQIDETHNHRATARRALRLIEGVKPIQI